MEPQLDIGNRIIGPGQPAFIIAEMSANHNHSFEEAVRLIEAAAKCGVDAIKLQTYTPDTMTIDVQNDYFRVGKGTIWEGKFLHGLYGEAYTPWEWQPKLKTIAEDLGLVLFSTPFDATAVDFLEKMDVALYKIASFEVIDHPLLAKVAATGKPVIMSIGMCTLTEVEEAVSVLRQNGCKQLALLKCTSAYPAPPEVANLRTIPHLAQTFNVTAGVSDHTLTHTVAIAAVALGATIVEKHFTLSRATPGPDAAFSLEPHEMASLVQEVRTVEAALGKVNYTLLPEESASKVFRRSLFIVKDVKAGETLTAENVRVIRPGYGLAPKYVGQVMGKTATVDLTRGTPLEWKHVNQF